MSADAEQARAAVWGGRTGVPGVVSVGGREEDDPMSKSPFPHYPSPESTRRDLIRAVLSLLLHQSLEEERKGTMPVGDLETLIDTACDNHLRSLRQAMRHSTQSLTPGFQPSSEGVALMAVDHEGGSWIQRTFDIRPEGER